MITDKMLMSILGKLTDDSFCKERWYNSYAEIQDDGQSIFVSVCVENKPIGKDIKNDIASLIVSTIPSGGEPTIGNWMIGFLIDGKVIDSWAPYDL